MNVFDEHPWVTQLQTGSTSEKDLAFAALWRAFSPKLLKLCFSILGNRAEAEDVLQEAWVTIYRTISGFRNESRFSTWALRIAVRLAIKHKALRRPTESIEFFPLPGENEEANQVHRDHWEKVQRAMTKLSAEHSTVISLFAIDGLGHKEVAEILGIPEGTVWSRLHSARKALIAATEIPRT